jgi:hypothetical protein
MSNYLAIATVTATLQKMLQDAVQSDVEGARITTVKPDTIGKATPETGVNIFLYRVAPLNWRSSDLPGKRSTGDYVKRPQIALELNYMFTVYGNETELEPQRLLGSVIRTLNSNPMLEKNLIRGTIFDSNFRFLEGSDLQEQIESIKFMFLPLSTEDLSKIWSVFFQTPYSLSVAYQVNAVLIEGKEIPRRALPVREFRPQIVAFGCLIKEIISLDPLTKYWKSSQPLILSNSSILISGERLKGEITIVRINSVDKEINPDDVAENKIFLNLTSFAEHELRAGVQGMSILQRNYLDDRISITSNVFPFVIFPRITDLELVSCEEIEDNLYLAQVRLLVNPFVGSDQLVYLILNELSADKTGGYVFKVPFRDSATNNLTVPITNVKSGEYLVRIQVNNVDSLLGIDTETDLVDLPYNSPTIFIG